MYPCAAISSIIYFPTNLKNKLGLSLGDSLSLSYLYVDHLSVIIERKLKIDYQMLYGCQGDDNYSISNAICKLKWKC